LLRIGSRFGPNAPLTAVPWKLVGARGNRDNIIVFANAAWD
jgi:hypothetical protein